MVNELSNRIYPKLLTKGKLVFFLKTVIESLHLISISVLWIPNFTISQTIF
jgi:hypothetical protein